MASITICSDFGAPQNKVWHCFHCFPIYLPWNDGIRCLYMCLLAICMSSLGKCLFISLDQFLIGLFIFLVLSWMCCLYIFEINSLSIALLAVIVSHSEGCLFTLLIVSFTVQKTFKFNYVPFVYFCFYFHYSGR